MRIVFHGGAREVGRSCIEIFTQGDRYLLDAGVKFVSDGLDYPEEVFKLREIDGMFLSHAHLDHSGALPLFEHNNLICPIMCTAQTKIISRVLLRDSYKVARIKHIHPAYSRKDIRKVWDAFKLVNWGKWYNHRKVNYKLYNAGHIPGSACIQLEAEGKNILYTGDFNTRETRLMKPADTNYDKDIDLLICESTYGNKELPPRDEEERRFKKTIQETLERGGTVLVPVFALGRSQEVLIMLSEENYDVPIYFDGMSQRITKRILNNPSSYVANKDNLAEMFFNKVINVKNDKQRDEATSRPSIILTTSGMMQGGPVMHYMQDIWGDPKSSVLLMGFQAKGTNGRHLFEDGYIYLDGTKTNVKCHYDKFEFSGHLSLDDIKNYVRHVNPKKVAFVHGDPESVDNLTSWAQKKTETDVYGPEIGDELEF